MLLEPIPNGVSGFEWSYRDGSISNFQIYSNGAMYYADDVIRSNNEGQQLIYLDSICANIIICLRYASFFYLKVGYIGPVNLSFKINNISGVQIRRITMDGYSHEPLKNALLNDYQLDLNTNTFNLSDTETKKDLERQIIYKIHWHFGFENKNWDVIYDKFLSQI